jgi:hypothetical protein
MTTLASTGSKEDRHVASIHQIPVQPKNAFMKVVGLKILAMHETQQSSLAHERGMH